MGAWSGWWRGPACCVLLLLLLLLEGPGLAVGASAPAPSSAKDVCTGASYTKRIDNKGYYDWCVVPGTSYDVVLFGGLAVVLACLLQGKLNTLMVLAAGAILMAIAWPVNLGALGNSLAIWLGISPWQLFFYVFLPPLLLDAAVRIDWYLFKKSVLQVFTLAFLVVGATCIAMVPIMLYMLDLRKYGWEWIHACMFGAMIASTDAVAIVSIMKSSGGPKRLRVLLEGESLLNDASGLTLFEVFFHILQEQFAHPEHTEPVGVIVGHVFVAVIQLSIIGFIMGMVFGVLTRLFLRFMRHMGAGHDQEVALTVGMAYLAYWVTGMPCKGSGVVAVAIMGLYGASTNCWDMSTAAHHTFDGFWETLAFVVNSLVFMWSGAHVVNFFIRASEELQALGLESDLATTVWMLPIIYIILMLLRYALTALFRPLFILIKGDINNQECIFVTFAGLRGSASLIMGSAVVTQQFALYAGTPETFPVVKSMMVFWTAGFVLLTLGINAPMLPFILRITGLSKVPEKQLERRRRAVDALADHSRVVLEQLRDAEDELLAGVDWGQVAAFVDHGRRYRTFTGAPTPPGPIKRLLLGLWTSACCCCPCLPPWLTGSSAAAATAATAAAAQQQQLLLAGKGDDKKDPDQGHGYDPGKGHSNGKGHGRKRRHKGHKNHDRLTDGVQQGLKAALPVVVAAAAAGDAGAAAVLPQLLQLPVSSSSEGDGARPDGDAAAPATAATAAGATALPNGSVSRGTNGQFARETAVARLTGDSKGSLWGSGKEETTEAEQAGSSSSDGGSSSDGDEALPRQQQQQQQQRQQGHGRSRLGISNTFRRQRTRRREAQQRHVSGTVSDSEGSSSGSSSSSSSDDGAGSSAAPSVVSRYESNLMNDVFPFLQAHEVDVMQQECPFLLASAMQQQRAAAASGTTATAGTQQLLGGQDLLPVSQQQLLQQHQHKGFMGFFERWKKNPAAAAAVTAATATAAAAAGSLDESSLTGSAAGVELQRASGSISTSSRLQQQQQQGSASGTLTHAAAAAAPPQVAFDYRPGFNLGQPSLSAYAAASASRSNSLAPDTSAAGSSGRPMLPGRGANRSLASRSAAPALIYGGTSSFAAGSGPAAAAAAGGSGFDPTAAMAPSQPGHRRKGSDGAGVGRSQDQQQQQPSRPLSVGAAGTGGPAAAAAPPAAGSWGLAGGWAATQGQEPAAAVAAAAAVGSLRSSSAVGQAGGGPAGARGLQTGTEKALGRRSGMYGQGRSLGTRSTTLADRYGGGSTEPFTPFQPFHLPEAEVAEGAVLSRHSSSFAAQPESQGSARSLRRASSEHERRQDRADSWDAAALAVDMVSLERNTSSRTLGAATSGLNFPASGTSASNAPGFPTRPGSSGLPRAGSRGLASRSVGLSGAYGPPGGMDGGSQLQDRPSFRPHGHRPSMDGKSLATRSNNPHLPAVVAVAPSLSTISTGLAAYNKGSAAGAAEGSARQPPGLPWGPLGRTERGLAASSVPVAGIVAAAAAAAATAAAAPRSTTAGSNDGSTGGGGSTGNLLSMLRSSVGMSRPSSKPGKSMGRAFTDDEEGYSDGDGISDPSKLPEMNDADLADARSWLVTGLKRYFHAKRMEGLLSARGLRILDNGCEVLLESPEKPLHLWCIIRGDCANNTLVRLITYLLFGCRQAAVGMMTWGRIGRWLAWPLKVAASMLQRPLNKVLLMSVEVAMEYLMGLTTSPHVEQLQENEAWAALLAEISAEAGQVAQFLIDREIEAPERYSAVQSYRVAMAVLRQQRLFVETLFESGMLDATETSALSHPVEAAERRLELLGPVWRAPSVLEVLRQLPFMRGQPQSMLEFFLRHGQLVMLGKGNNLPLDKVLYVVQSGIVKVTYSPDLGDVQEYFLGSGGLINLYGSLTGESMPGLTEAVAQGNALGKGPVLFCLSGKGLRRMASAAAAGNPAFQQLELDMFRLAGLFLIERLKPQLDMEASQALARLAPLTTAGGHHRDKRSSRAQRAAWVRQKLAAMRASLKAQLVLGELLVLSEGASVVQDSHVILMKGTIQVKVSCEGIMAQPGSADIARWMANAGRHQHQSILPWFWDLMCEDDLQRAPAGTPQQPLPVTISAGAEGATLLVCPSRFPDSAQLSTAADHHQPAAGNTLLLPPGQGFGQGQNPANVGSQGTPGGLKPPMLTRQSPGSSLARISPVLAGRVGPQKGVTGGVAGSPGMPGVMKLAQNTYSRRNMAAAVAAADALMSPLPGSSAAAARLAAVVAAGGGVGGVGGSLARVSPTPVVSRVSPSPGSLTAAGGAQGNSDKQQQGQAGRAASPAGGVTGVGGGPPSLSRTSSNTPLAGTQVDTAVSLGVDVRAGPMGSLSLGLQSDLGAAVAAATGVGSVAGGGDASAAMDDGAHLPSSLAVVGGAAVGAGSGAAAAAGEGGEGQAAAEAAAASRRQQLRRSKSQRPLHGTGGTQGGERHVGR